MPPRNEKGEITSYTPSYWMESGGVGDGALTKQPILAFNCHCVVITLHSLRDTETHSNAKMCFHHFSLFLELLHIGEDIGVRKLRSSLDGSSIFTGTLRRKKKPA